MQCYNHPESGAVAACASCGKGVCETCAVEVGGRVYCKQCLAAGLAGVAPGRVGVAAARPTNGAAILSLVLSIIGLLVTVVGCCILPICFAPLGAILGVGGAVAGYVARQQIAESAGAQGGEEMAMVGLVLGVITAIVGVLLFVIFGALFALGILGSILEAAG
jgi:hypothetical protein